MQFSRSAASVARRGAVAHARSAAPRVVRPAIAAVRARAAAPASAFSSPLAAWFAAHPKIMYTKTDEAPALATYSLLPIIRRFTDPAGIDVELADISVAARILAAFPERLTAEQRVPDTLAALGELAKTPEANIIKLPNVSASLPQLIEAIAELQGRGYDIPNYTAEPKTDEERDIKARYGGVLGSAVNPVLREGNSDRRAAPPVKAFAQKHPKSLGAWPEKSATHVANMDDGDFYSSEKAMTVPAATTASIIFQAAGKEPVTLREGVALQAKEVIDASRMSKKALCEFFEREIADAYKNDILFSLHLKATMMKVSDPIMFGHCVRTFFSDVFAKHADTFAEMGVNPNNGLGDVYDRLSSVSPEKAAEIEADIKKQYETRPRLAMVNSSKGITNLHVPSDVIIDASMPVVIRDSGMMWNKDDKLEDTKCVIPDRSYAGIYAAVVDHCKRNGQFDPSTMGHVSNVGLMAQKAQEYGSHPSTFEIPEDGTVRVVDASGSELFSHTVDQGDIWRMCQVKDEPIRDWVKLAVSRARATGDPAVFWLDENRAHDQQIRKKVDAYLKEEDTNGLEILIQNPKDAMTFACERAVEGKDTITCTGNVLRDYLTDLFPILELGTSAKMLSIVPLLAGGGLYETGAGGSAPKHVEQFVDEGHLRWDSLGEYLALAVSLEGVGEKDKNERAALLGKTLFEAVGEVLENRKSPSRKVNEIDNRATNFYIAMYWANAVAKHDAAFKPLADALAANEDKIVSEMVECQGKPVDIGGYYLQDDAKAEAAMQPSETFNRILQG
jgi:isocitrate dehydrogenase